MPCHNNYTDMDSLQCVTGDGYLMIIELSYACLDYTSVKIWFLPRMSHHMFIKTTTHWKCFSHMVHWYGFFPVWVIICWFRLLIHENAFSHKLHWYGFSPVCVIICVSRVLLWENAFSHWIHLYGFSPEWAFICWPRFPLTNSIWNAFQGIITSLIEYNFYCSFLLDSYELRIYWLLLT